MEEKLYKMKRGWAVWTALGITAASLLSYVIVLASHTGMGSAITLLIVGLVFFGVGGGLTIGGLLGTSGKYMAGGILSAIGFFMLGFTAMYAVDESFLLFLLAVLVGVFGILAVVFRIKSMKSGRKTAAFVFVGLAVLSSLIFMFFSVGFANPIMLYYAAMLISMFAETETETIVHEVTQVEGGQLPESMLKKSKIWKLILLTAVTFGIYGYIWFYRNAKKVRILNGESAEGCGNEVFLSIIFGLFYNPYWYYTRAKQMNASAKKRGLDGIVKKPVVYLLLTLFGLELIAKIMVTADFNKMAAVMLGEREVYSEPSQEAKIRLTAYCGIIKIVLLSVVTLGVYWRITVYRLANKVKLINGRPAARGKQVIAMLLVPFYWVYWLISRRGKYHEGSNEATMEAFCLFVLPLYSTYWLITRSRELAVGAQKLGVAIEDESLWMLIFASLIPALAYLIMQVNCNKIASHLADKGV